MNDQIAKKAIRNAGITSSLITLGIVVLFLFNLIQNPILINLIFLVIPCLFLFLTYRIFKGGLFAIITYSVMYIGAMAAQLYFSPPSSGGIVILAVVGTLVFFMLKGVESALWLKKNKQIS